MVNEKIASCRLSSDLCVYEACGAYTHTVKEYIKMYIITTVPICCGLSENVPLVWGICILGIQRVGLFGKD